MKIQNVTDDSFRKYGKVLEGYDFTALIREMKHTPVPENVIYVPSARRTGKFGCGQELQNKGRWQDFLLRSDTVMDITGN